MDHEEFLLNLNENLTKLSVDELKNENFITGINNGNLKFLTVVESIQGVLTVENAGTREKGIKFLSWILSRILPSILLPHEISPIVTFYCERLQDFHNIIPPSIQGLQALMEISKMSKEDVIKILGTLFQHVICQSQQQPDRYNIYSILKHVVENNLEDVRGMGPDFVFGVISFIEGESDPKCLLLIFQFLPHLIKRLDLGHLNEEMFEILSCYFPIDFNAAAKDNINITREDLAKELHQCLSSISLFSEQCLPMILEKLDSSFKTAKMDSYKLLQECCRNLKVEILENHLSELWKNLVKDVLPGNDKQICDAGLSALTDVVELLSQDGRILSSSLNDILTTVRSLTNRVDENMFQSAIKVFVATSAKSKTAAAQVLCHLKPFFHLESTNTLMEKKIILTSLLPFPKLCSAFKLSESEEPEVVTSYLELVNLYLSHAISVEFEVRKLAFAGISELIPDLSQEFKSKLLNIVIENIKIEEDIHTSEEFLKIWRQLAQDVEFRNTLFNGFSTNISEPRFMWALSLIADLPNFSGFVIPVFVKVITSSKDYFAGLESLLNACVLAKQNPLTDFYHVIYFKHNIVEFLISWWMERKPDDMKIHATVSKIIALVVRNQKSEAQQIIADKFAPAFLHKFSYLNGSGDFNSVLILEAILGSVRVELTPPMLSAFRENLTNLALRSPDDSVRLSSSRLLASFANKLNEPKGLLEEIRTDIFKELDRDSEPRVKSNSAFLFTWVLKGVILSGDSSSEEWIPICFDLLGREDVGEAVAEGFRTVIQEDEFYLNLESHCNVKVLYRQRLFGYFSKLKSMYEASKDTVKMNYLLALVRLLQGVPIHLMSTEISNVVLLLIRCLDVDKPDVLFTSLQILTALLETRETIFSDHIRSFVPRFLKLARFEGSLKIRMSALKCLYSYGFYPTFVLLPIKNQVVQDLESCLDDKKRLVRKEAVRARCRWFLVGAPGEDILNS